MADLKLDGITVAFDYSSPEAADIRRCLETLYQTPEGTCPLDREFGINNETVGKPPDVAQNELAVEIQDKTDRYEPRAQIKEINFTATQDGLMQAEVRITNG